MSPVSLPASVLPNQPLAGLTSWRVGGAAEYLAQPDSVDQLAHVVRWAVAMGLPVHPIGAGSNLLVSDEGVQGLSLCLRRLQGARFEPATGWIECYAGEPLPSLARKARASRSPGPGVVCGHSGNRWRSRCHECGLSGELPGGATG